MTSITKTLSSVSVILALLALQSASAEIYKTVDEDGNVVFTDTPGKNTAEPVKLPEINTQPATRITIKLSPPKDENKAPENKPGDYTITMVSPTNETTVTMGQMTLSSRISITTALDGNHRIQFYLDSIPSGKASESTSHIYSDLIRGTHTIHAAVLDKKGKTLKQSEPVTIYVHRARIKGASVTYGQI